MIKPTTLSKAWLHFWDKRKKVSKELRQQLINEGWTDEEINQQEQTLGCK